MRDHWVEAYERLYGTGQESDPDPADDQVQEAVIDRYAARADRLKDEWKERGGVVSRPDHTNAERKRRMRQKRAKDGLTEVRVWLEAEEIETLRMQRVACGMSPVPPAKAIAEWLKGFRPDPESLVLTLSPTDAALVLILMGHSDTSAIRPSEYTAEGALRIVQALKARAKEEEE